MFWVYLGIINHLPIGLCNLGGGGGDFAGLVHSSFPHLLPDLTRDSISGSSLFLAALRSSSLPSAPSSSSSAPPLFASSSSSSAAPLFLHSSQAAVPPPPPPPSHLSDPRLPVGSVGAGPFPPSATPFFPGLAHPPAFGFAPSSRSPAPPPSVSAPAPPPPTWPSFSAASSLPSSSSVQGSAGVQGLGVGYPLSSGVPPFPQYQSTYTAYPAPPAADWPPASAPAYGQHAFASSIPRAEDFADPDERLPDEDHAPLVPSTPLFQ